MTWSKRWLRRLRTLIHRGAVERELDEELAFHLEMETEKLRRAGVSEQEARRRARIAFGGVQDVKEGVRDERWLAWASGFSLDLRLGARMLVKSPGLAIVGGLGMAVAIAVSAGAFAMVNSYFYPDVPLDEGDRIVSIVNRDPLRGGYDRRVIHDFGVWRREMRSIVDFGAFRTIQRNLIAPSSVEPVTLAEMTASGFRAARIAPLLGRTLVDEDERTGAPPVVVIGERVWRTRFQSDPAIIGSAVPLGEVPYTIVGVMPEEFAFPVSHSWWVPLRANPDAYPPGTGPSLHVFGRLAPGVTRDEAQAELTVLGRRLAASRRNTPLAVLEPLIMPYTDIFTNAADDADGMRVMRLTITLLLVLVAMNVGILVYARTVSRTGEIAVRTALGATRRRIVTQLFAEALVLSSLSAAVGLGMVSVGLRWLDRAMRAFGNAPFWIDTGVTAGTVIHALLLSILGAAIAGLFPALRATRNVRVTIGSANNESQARLGATWTALIVVQVAAAVAILPPALLKSVEFARQWMLPAAFQTEEFLAAGFSFEREQDPTAEREEPEQAEAARAEETRVTLTRLIDRLAEEPAVAGTAVSNSVPWSGGMDPIEVEGQARRGKTFYLDVGPNWFELFEVPLLAGRTFVAADAPLDGPRAAVIVNRSFVTDVLGGGAAVGRRVRYESHGDEVQPWFEIVGVIEDFPAGFRVPGLPAAKMYHPTAAGAPYTDTLNIRLRGQTPAEFTPTLRRIAASVDPMLQITWIDSLDASFAGETRSFGQIALGIAVFAASVLLLSAAGIHSLVSFTVNKRRREIGIRAALGAGSRQILTSVLSRAAGQLSIGVVVGLALTLLADRATGGELMSGAALLAVPATAAVALLVGMIAAAGPARRALGVQPTEAIRTE